MTALPIALPAHGLLLAAGAVEVDFNPLLVLVQFVVVTALMLALKPMLFDPLLKLFEEREKRSEGARAEARKMDDKAADILRKYEHELEKVTRAAAEERDKVRAEAQRVEAAELEAARKEAAEILEIGRKKLADETAALDAQLKGVQPDLAKQIAARVLGREVA